MAKCTECGEETSRTELEKYSGMCGECWSRSKDKKASGNFGGVF